jgi:hypothetical protein
MLWMCSDPRPGFGIGQRSSLNRAGQRGGQGCTKGKSCSARTEPSIASVSQRDLDVLACLVSTFSRTRFRGAMTFIFIVLAHRRLGDIKFGATVAGRWRANDTWLCRAQAQPSSGSRRLSRVRNPRFARRNDNANHVVAGILSQPYRDGGPYVQLASGGDECFNEATYGGRPRLRCGDQLRSLRPTAGEAIKFSTIDGKLA